MSEPRNPFLLGDRGLEARISERVAAALERHTNIGELRARMRGEQTELAVTLEAIHRAARAGRAHANTESKPTETPVARVERKQPSSPRVSAMTAHEWTGLSPQWLVKLAKRGEISGRQPRARGHWSFETASIAAYLERKPR